jgi:protein-L-isoaspartate(D-aspartate) O-methyltransferase
VRRPLHPCVLLSLLAAACSPAAEDTGRTEERERMVRDQIAAREVRDEAVLAAMRRVPRHRFVPAHLSRMAYQDTPLPIGHGQTISQPFIVAFMTEAAAVKPGAKVLEIGTGSGYQAAVLAEMRAQVFTIEIIPPLAERSGALLKELGYENVRVRTGDGYKGWPEEAPFDAIIVTAAPDEIPQPLLDQLAEGGRLVIPVGPEGRIQHLTLVRKINGKLDRRTLMPVRFVPFTREGG